MRLSSIFRKRELWAIHLYRLSSLEEVFNLESKKSLFSIGEKGYRINRSYQSTVADPFLFPYQDKLYVFYEVKTDHKHGVIWGGYLDADNNWFSLGEVLSEDFHLSYPQVFRYKNEIYMMPETKRSGQVILYVASEFPRVWERHTILVETPLADPTLYQKDQDEFYLFGTDNNDQLKMLFSTAPNIKFKDMGVTITSDRKFSRCGGNIFKVDGALYRAAQDCSDYYGKKINLQKIVSLSKNGYDEVETKFKIFEHPPRWASIGHHHFSSVNHLGSVYVAVDGRSRDLFVNNISLAALRISDYAKSLNINRSLI